MKRLAVLLLCIVLLFSMSACGAKNDALQYVEECWEEIDSHADDIYQAFMVLFIRGFRVTGVLL